MMKKLLAITLFGLASFSQAQTKITLQPENAETTISKHIYGHFAEHLGRCIYDGIYTGDRYNIETTNGVRNDVIDALKQLQIPNLRWPGGCFADSYHWKDAIGPKDQRKPIENTSWGGREDNSFGTHEFLNLCEQLDAEPYLAVNMNTGTVQEAVEWEQYVNNANGSSHLTDTRAANGRDKPWNVKYWGIGNESWDCGGHMSADYYVNLYKRYATAMTSYGNTEKLYRIAVGPGQADYEWTETIMKEIPARRIEGISIHHYSVYNWSDKGSSYEFTEEEYFKVLERAWFMEEFITKNSEVMDKYDTDKRVKLIVDEWGSWYNTMPEGKGALYQQNTIRDAMLAGMTLNIFNNHADRVHMANLAQTVNVLQAVILTEGPKMVLTPTYHVMEMYKVHQDARLVPLKFTSSEYSREGHSIPALTASASINNSGAMNISLTNIDPQNSQSIEIDLGVFTGKKVTGRILTSNNIQDLNTFEKPDKVKPAAFNDAKISKGTLKLTVPKNAVIVLTIQP